MSSIVKQSFEQRFRSFTPPFFAEKERIAKLKDLFPEIDAIYREYAEKNHFPGYAYGIVLDGQLICSGSGGFINLNQKIRATPQSMFRIASMTKSLTAMAILKLRDEGKIHLDDPVELYIPELQQQKLTKDSSAITIRDLLMHSAGLPTDNPWADRKLDGSDEAFFTFLKKGIFFSNTPGSFEYSNLGYAILGYVIKKIAGVSCGKYIQSEILQPLGMNSSWEFSQIPQSQLAHGYRWSEEQWNEEKLLPDGSFGPIGGMIDSIESFSRYIAYHQSAWPPRNDEESGPLKRSSIREMHRPWNFCGLSTNFKYEDGQDRIMVNAYGFGLQSWRDSQGKTYVGHSGGLPGFGSNWWIMPDYGLGAILLANVTYAPASKPNLQILNRLSEQSEFRPRQWLPSKILKERQRELLELLPDWKNAAASSIFAENFFLDCSLDSLKKESSRLFSNAGKILATGDLIPETQLRGYFILEGETVDIRIAFGLTAENPSLIQEVQMKEVPKPKN